MSYEKGVMEEMIKTLRAKLGGDISPDNLKKAWNQASSATSGITAYDLTAPAKSLVPVITPLRNSIPRIGGGTGIQDNWRAITGVNSTGANGGVSQGLRGQIQQVTTKDYTAPYATIGIEDYATDEAQLAAMGFDDLLAIVTLNNLRALMIAEEKLIIGGIGTGGTALGTAATPSLTPSNSGGVLTNAFGTYSVKVVALTLNAYTYWRKNGTLPVSGNQTVAGGDTVFYNMGTGQISASATTTIASGSTGSISATVTAQSSAVAYAWFIGAAGTEVLNQVTTINSAKIINATGSQTPANFGVDYSIDPLVFNGLFSQMNFGSSGAYLVNQATGTAGTGTQLTSDNEGGCVEIDTALKSFWDNYQMSPTRIMVNSQEQASISQIVLTGSTAGAQRFVFNVEQGNLKGGTIVRSYFNKFTMAGQQELPIELHPNMPPGTIMFYSDQIPYPLSNVANVVQVKTRRDYHQIDWPRTKRRYEYGVYADEVLEVFAPFAFGLITNIGAPTVI